MTVITTNTVARQNDRLVFNTADRRTLTRVSLHARPAGACAAVGVVALIVLPYDYRNALIISLAAMTSGQLRDVAVPGAGGYALDPGGAAAVPDEDDLLLADRLDGPLDALVGADDEVHVGVGLEHVLRGLQAEGRREEALACATTFTGLPAIASSKDFLIARSSAEALMSKR